MGEVAGDARRHRRRQRESLITVDDDGPGLDPALRDRVLQRGVRADEAAPGSGLGLAIVRDLAELYGGASRSSTARPRAALRAACGFRSPEFPSKSALGIDSPAWPPYLQGNVPPGRHLPG